MHSLLQRGLHRLAWLGIGTVALASAAGAQTWVLEFNDPPWNAGNGTAIPASYGDVAGMVDVTIQHRSGWGNTAVTPGAFHWIDGYNDLSHVGYTSSAAGVGEVVLDNLAAGQSIFFNSADVGAWPNVGATVALRVYDFGWNLLYSGTGLTVAAPPQHVHFAGSPSDADGLYVQWSRIDGSGNPIDAYNTGLDNLSFTIGTAAVAPEPSTLVLLAGGLAVTALGARRRRTR